MQIAAPATRMAGQSGGGGIAGTRRGLLTGRRSFRFRGPDGSTSVVERTAEPARRPCPRAHTGSGAGVFSTN